MHDAITNNYSELVERNRQTGYRYVDRTQNKNKKIEIENPRNDTYVTNNDDKFRLYI